MTITNLGEFTLEGRHLKQGLTSEDFTTYAGCPVAIVYLSDLPHWNKLGKGIVLSEAEAIQRAQKLKNTLDKFGPPFSGAFTREVLMPSASNEIPSVNMCYMNLPTHPHIMDALTKAQVFLQDNINQRIPISKDRFLVVPEIPCVDHKNSSLSMVSFAFGLLNFPSKATAKHWSNNIIMPQNTISNYPKDNLIHIFDALHEMRHLSQGRLYPPQIGDSEYYLELDADLFAHNAFREAKIGDETLKAHIHSRYIGFLFSPHKHWFAPAIEAVESGKQIPSFDKIINAGEEICCRLANGTPEANKNYSQTPAFLSWSHACLFQRPDIGFSQLRILTDSNKLSSIAQSIGEKIVAAGEYFSPGISQTKLTGPNLRFLISPHP